MWRSILLQLLAALTLPCSALEALDPARGDALEAAVLKDDAEGLKKLLVPEDRKEGAKFVTAEAKKGGYFYPFQNLILHARKQTDKGCYHVLLDYGVDIEPGFLERADLKEIVAHYPDFTKTLGRRGMRHACKIGNTELLKSLMELEVSPQPTDLDTAVTFNNPGAVRVLLAAGIPKTTVSQDEQDKGLTMVQLARKRMFFDVLAALGEEAKYAEELKPFREGRPGPGASRFVGEWEFINRKNRSRTRYVLAADGSGLEGFDDLLGMPILWKLVEAGGKAEVQVQSVAAYAFNPDHAKLVIHFPVKRDILGSPYATLGDGRKVRMSSDHRDAFTAAAAAKAYDGPVGEWGAQGDIEKLPADQQAEAREMLKTWKLIIAGDGSAKMTGPEELSFKAQVDQKSLTMTLMGPGRPPISLSSSPDWNTLTFSIPGETMSVRFVRAAK